MEHLRKILILLDYFVVKFELISSIEVKLAFKKTGKKLQNFEKKIQERLGKFLGNFTLHLGKAVENQWNFKINFVNV